MATPIVVFVYNRAKYTETLLKSLERCRRLEECRVMIFSDGARGEKDVEAVQAVRKVAEKWALTHGAELVRRPANLGLARSVVGGVSEGCKQFGRAIVVEDDFQVNPGFLDFMLQALDRYQDEEQVAQVSGYLYPVRVARAIDAFMMPLFTTRGWATWERVWNNVVWEPRDAIEMVKNPDLAYRFDVEGSYPFTRMLFDRFDGKNEAWEVDFWWHVFTQNKLVVYPRQALVWVEGFDGSGVHSGNKRLRQTSYQKVMGFNLPGKIHFPETVATNEIVFERVKEFMRSRNAPPSLARRVKGKILRMLGDERPETI